MVTGSVVSGPGSVAEQSQGSREKEGAEALIFPLKVCPE